MATQMKFAGPPYVRHSIPGVSKIDTASEFE